MKAFLKKSLPLSLFLLVFCFFIGTLLDYGKYYLIDIGVWRPEIFCESPSKNLGKISIDETPVCDFLIKNIGSKELEIISVAPGCGACVEVVSFPQKPIPAGQADKIILRLLSHKLKGTVEKRTIVKSNDPLTTLLTLTIKANLPKHPTDN